MNYQIMDGGDALFNVNPNLKDVWEDGGLPILIHEKCLVKLNINEASIILFPHLWVTANGSDKNTIYSNKK